MLNALEPTKFERYVGKIPICVSVLAVADGLTRTYQVLREDIPANYQAV